ncbi:MAG: hypothetical protein QOF51_2119 [Chloroflexota bacterium]|jgi:hypothetical protein|nr:hypothetical protein [Chloroflexota bacterium]
MVVRPLRALGPLLTLALVLQTVLMPGLAAAQSAPVGSAQFADLLDESEDQACNPVLTVDVPTAGATVSGTATIRGWVLDLAQPTGSGVDMVHVYMDGEAGNGGTGLGVAQVGIARPDVDAAFGRSPSRAGWQLAWSVGSTTAGPHTLYVYAHTACGWSFATVPIVVLAPSVRISVDSPPANATANVNQILFVSGWAADPAASIGTGVDAVHVYLDGQAGAGGVGLGVATYGTARPDVAAALGRPAWANSGFTFPWRVTNVAPGPHTLYVYAHSRTGDWQFQTVPITILAAIGVPVTPPIGVPPVVTPIPIVPPTPVVTPTPLPGPPGASGYPRGSTGYTISFPQCGNPYPALPYAFGILGVEGGRSFTQNACLASQYAWARAAGGAPSVYINTGYPAGSTATNGATGPAGNCTPTDEACQAYNYGYNNAIYAVSYARAQGVNATVWWLDVETENSWSDTTTLNARAIQGGIDGLHAQGLTVGIYSTSYQWGLIAGSFNPGVPVWTVGPQTPTGAAATCTPSAAFGGGPVALVSYFTGTFDAVYAC